MSPRKPRDEAQTRATPWSPETETRPPFKALLGRRSTLVPEEVMLFRELGGDIYETYRDTMCCVVRARGVTGAAVLDLVHDALTRFWDESIKGGLPERLQSRLLSLASGLAKNEVRHEGLNPATQAMPTSSNEPPGSFPKLERELDLQAVARALWDRLSPEHQAVIDAVIINDQTVVDAARALRLPRRTLRSRLTAAVARLHEMVEAMLTESERHV
jgi:DNA-directed RNA polymerase specialized sigma24 family protein